MKAELSRVVNRAERYYTIEILPNLFGEWLLVRSYGSLKYRPCMKAQVFESLTSAKEAFRHLLGIKMKKGYIQTATIRQM